MVSSQKKWWKFGKMLLTTHVLTHHVTNHVHPECKPPTGRFNPANEKFQIYQGVNDQVCEQTWKEWGPIKSITRTASEWRTNWLLYVFWQCRNEHLERKMMKKKTLLRSGMSGKRGFLLGGPFKGSEDI